MPDNIYIYIKPIYIYNQLEMRSKLRTRQIYIYNKYTYTQGCLSESDGPSAEQDKKIHTYTTNVHTLKAASQRLMAQAPNTTKIYIYITNVHILKATSPLAIMLPLRWRSCSLS